MAVGELCPLKIGQALFHSVVRCTFQESFKVPISCFKVMLNTRLSRKENKTKLYQISAIRVNSNQPFDGPRAWPVVCSDGV